MQQEECGCVSKRLPRPQANTAAPFFLPSLMSSFTDSAVILSCPGPPPRLCVFLMCGLL